MLRVSLGLRLHLVVEVVPRRDHVRFLHGVARPRVVQFRDGRLTSLRMLIDTFDLVEQTLGQPIPLPQFA